MKKTSGLLIIVLMVFATFTQSCSTDNEVLTPDQNFEKSANESEKKIKSIPDPDCKIKSQYECASPLDVLIYHVDAIGSDWVVTPDDTDMSVNIINENSIEVTFGCDFDGGVLTLINSRYKCEATFAIDLCDQVPETCTITGPECGEPGQDITLTYNINSTSNPSPVNWTINNEGISMTSNDGENPATFHLDEGVFAGGTVTASYTNSECGNDCSQTIEIPLCSDGTGDGTTDTDNEPCVCPEPFIDDRACVSGGHPHWRFEVEDINNSDDIVWTVNHGTIHSSPYQSYVIIEPDSNSTYGFTVYCEVTRTCDDGTTKTRTAYYTNYYGNECGTGTTGFTSTSCSGSGGGGEIDEPFQD